jgi:hypothetical protein
VPGGFSEVVTSQTVGAAGMDIKHLDLDGLNASLDIRPDTFLTPVQVTVTEPFLRDSITTTAYVQKRGLCGSGPGIGDAGFRDYCAVGGAGIIVQSDGVDDTGRYLRPMVLRFHWKPQISDLVVRWNGRHFRIVRSAVTHSRGVKILIHRDADYVILRRMQASHGPRLSPRPLGLMDRWQQALNSQGPAQFP